MIFTDEHKQKLSQSHLGQIPWNRGLTKEMDERVKMISIGHKGKKFSIEHKLKLSRLHKGKKLSDEHRKKLSKAGMGRIAWSKGLTKETDKRIKKHSDEMIGKKLSYETRQKLSRAHKGIKRSQETRKNISNGLKKYYQKYPERREYARQLRLKQISPLQDTSIEKKIQESLMKENISFRVHEPILGQPDIFIEPNICIFVDGCYWHGCEQCLDRNKLELWIREKKAKDLFVTQNLINRGYKVLRFWEHDIKNNLNGIIESIEKEVNEVQICKIQN